MDKAFFEKSLREYVRNSSENRIKEEIALRPDLAGMFIFDEPLVGYAAAEDPYFEEAKKPGIIGDHFVPPVEWLPGAKTVIAIFLPFTEQVRIANRESMDRPADEWLHGRMEGQEFQDVFCRFAEDLLIKEGYSALAPMLDPRIGRGTLSITDKTDQGYHSRNLSERHAAYAAGLGTFGVSAGLITTRGVAGRFINIITNFAFEPDKRPYTGVYDYCIFCYACARNCPAKAISKEKGKLHYPCSEYLDGTREKFKPRYGCGKCQVKVPCEDKAPNAGKQNPV